MWVKGSVAKRLDERSYLVETNDKILRRNRVDLRKVPNQQPVTSQRRAVSEEPPEPRAVQPDFAPSEQPEETREEMKHEATKRMEAPPQQKQDAIAKSEATSQLRRSTREKHRPHYLKDYVT